MSTFGKFLDEVARDLKPAFEAGRADAATLFTTMSLDGTPLAGAAGVAAQVDVGPAADGQQVAQAELMAAPQASELDTGYRAFLAEQAATSQPQQQQKQMEIE